MREPDYRQIIREKMGDYRFTHSCNVAKEAVLLAKQYGGDEHKAYVAGILHDITKEIDGQEQLQIIKDGGIILDSVQKNAPKLWHAVSGSAYVRLYLGIEASDIINAAGTDGVLSKYKSDGSGDMCFYVEATKEFVVLSNDGYIRTYYICSGKSYYNRQ